MKIIQWIVAFMLLGSTLLARGFTLYSNDLSGQLSKTEEASSFGCDGANISPELHWSNAPKGTKSFAVTVMTPMLQREVASGIGLFLIFFIHQCFAD